MKAVLVGNYGVGNLGDEALREYFLQAFPDVAWQVLSASPKAGEYPRLPLGFRSFFGTRWLQTVRVLRGSDALVFGGGSLFTDVESLKACVLWGVHALVARVLRKPVILAFQGIGPFHTNVGAWIARSVCRQALHVSVRDAASAKRLQEWGIACTLTFDPVICLAKEPRCVGCPQDIVVCVPRLNSNDAFFSSCRKAVADHPGVSVEIWLFEPDHPLELRIAEAMAEEFKANVRRCESVSHVLSALTHVRHLVAQRYHAAILAFAAGCPVTIVEQKEGDKLHALRSLMVSGAALETALAAVKSGEQALRSALDMAKKR